MVILFQGSKGYTGDWVTAKNTTRGMSPELLEISFVAENLAISSFHLVSSVDHGLVPTSRIIYRP